MKRGHGSRLTPDAVTRNSLYVAERYFTPPRSAGSCCAALRAFAAITPSVYLRPVPAGPAGRRPFGRDSPDGVAWI
jgi:hypothetical protein